MHFNAEASLSASAPRRNDSTMKNKKNHPFEQSFFF